MPVPKGTFTQTLFGLLHMNPGPLSPIVQFVWSIWGGQYHHLPPPSSTFSPGEATEHHEDHVLPGLLRDKLEHEWNNTSQVGLWAPDQLPAVHEDV